MKKTLIFLTVLTFTSLPSLFAQKKALGHDEFDSWNSIENTQISNDGAFVLYQLTPGKGDAMLKIVEHSGGEVASFPRGEQAQFSWDAQQVIFRIKHPLDSINALKRVKTKKEKMPKDSLGIYHLPTGKTEKFPFLKGFKVPQKWSGYVFYQIEEPFKKKAKSDTTKAKQKKPSKKTGYHLIAYNVSTSKADTFRYVTKYTVAEKGKVLLYHTTGEKKRKQAGVYHYNFDTGEELPMCRFEKGAFDGLSLSREGDQVAFLADLDTTKALQRDHQLRFWKSPLDSAVSIAQRGSANLPDQWLVSPYSELTFSEDGENLFFGTSPPPLVQDTSLIEEEIIQVEVWSYTDSKIQTQQNVQLKDEREKNFLAVYRHSSGTVSQLCNQQVPEYAADQKMNGAFFLGRDRTPYDKYMTWEGFPRREDLYAIEVATGSKSLVKQDLKGTADVSPAGKHFFWYSARDTAWVIYDVEKQRETKLSLPYSQADERNDKPDYPRRYGAAGWTQGDAAFLFYDRYDLWKYEPERNSTTRLTEGRADKTRYRYLDLNEEEEAIDPKMILLSVFDEKTKSSGYAALKNLTRFEQIVLEPYRFDVPIKALESKNLVYTKESNERFPDLMASDLSFRETLKISNANPQQVQFNWSTVEPISWTSLDGAHLEGLVYKPEDFDANKQYPMITYFYERNAERLHNHWGMTLSRSIINPTFYASRGYIVFVPDIIYRVGYPGESCYNAVIPGVTSLIEKGFVDKENIGVQGHSWGGYQIAYLVTKTDIFKAAEAGAVVSNMTSAYGGIRWRTGLSRMFQYEHSQSRIGGTLWEYPLRYIENSPIFFADKVNTPLLLLHNDKDGAVPWYQGIEYFMALRRLNKPVWMLNYNDEPHWPTKWENKRDFKVRMQQYFDYYLQGSPPPLWMINGVPAIEKGIHKRLELSEE